MTRCGRPSALPVRRSLTHSSGRSRVARLGRAAEGGHDRHRRSGAADAARQGHLHGRPVLSSLTRRRGRRRPGPAHPRLPRRQPAARPVRRRGDGRPADDRPDGLPDHLHGDEGHRADEPSDRAGPGRAVRVAAVGGPRAQGPHEGGLHPDRRRPDRLHLGAGRRLPRQRHDAAGHPVRARAVRPGLQHRPAVLLRDRRPVASSAC